MKREDVKNKIPGITDEQLDWLMGENGRDVTAERKKADGLQAQVDSLTAQVATAQDGLKAFGEHKPEDFAAAQQQIAQLQQQMKDQADGYAFDSALDGAIRDARGRDVKAIRGMLDLDRLKGSKDRGADIQAALKALAEEKAWAFEDAAFVIALTLLQRQMLILSPAPIIAVAGPQRQASTSSVANATASPQGKAYAPPKSSTAARKPSL